MKQEDLFSTEDELLVHCIASDLKYNQGIAKQFDWKYPNMRKNLQSKDVKVGDCVILKMEEDSKMVANLITKSSSYGKPTYDTLRSSLKSLNDFCTNAEIKQISMPMIGCGLDKLKWNIVREMLEEELDKSININVYYLKGDIHS